MYIELNDIIIRDFARGDADALYRIVREPGIVRFMRDWSENAHTPEGYYEYLDWLQKQKDSTDVYENKRYAVALRATNELIGMVGMGREETLNEVEIAYFMSAAYQRKGYTARAVNALIAWCFAVSDVPYLIATIDCANEASCRVAAHCGFTLFEKRTPIGHSQPNMESDCYYYWRLMRK